MADDKSKRGAADRGRVSASEPYEVANFATKQGISKEDALEIIKKHGGNRKAADAAATEKKPR
ncbi:DUF3606 domain-containing protein [Rhizobium mesoamericanum]|uniref:DUF3606 domain-containing protein n=1 Tax=Rhizobium mesoamericanum TaxID=1079800 RepID=UPI00048DE3A6|nr:DUF3606 domain-containing protein [Rhizobium mesoamericanum]